MGLQLEGITTNEIHDSNDLEAASWLNVGVDPIQSTGHAAPDGSLTACEVIVNSSQNPRLYTSIDTVDANEPLQVGFWLKKINNADKFLVTQTLGGGTALGGWQIDLSRLSVGWEWITRDHYAVNEIAPFLADSSGDFGLKFRSNSGGIDESQFQLWGVNVQRGTTMTSCILSSGGATSRARTESRTPLSTLGLPDLSDSFSGHIQFRLTNAEQGTATFFLLYFDGNDTRMGIYRDADQERFIAYARPTGLTHNQVTYRIGQVGDLIDVHFRKATTGLDFWVNRADKQTVPNTAVPFTSALTHLSLGCNQNGGSNAWCEMEKIMITPVELSDEELLGSGVTFGGQLVTFENKVISFGN